MRKMFFMSLLAGMLLAGCSNNDLPEKGGESEGGETRYMAVNIMAPSTSSRASVNMGTDYEDGTDNENAVDKIRFYFFKGTAAADVKKSGDNYVNFVDVAENISTVAGESPNIEKKLKAIVVINPQDDGIPDGIVAIINPDLATLGENSKSLTELQAIAADYSYKTTGTGAKFLMSNSVYAEDSKTTIVAPVTSKNLQPLANLAENNPVDIYVERVLAKVIFNQTKYVSNGAVTLIPAKTKNEDGTTSDLKVKVGNEEKQIYIKLLGWNVTANIDKSNLIKKIDPSWNATTNWGTNNSWNYPKFHRSFWAINPSGATVSLPAESDNGGYGDFDDAQSNNNFTDGYTYCQENASESQTSLSVKTPTKVIIAAQLQAGNGENVEAATIYEHAGQRWLEESACITTMLTGASLNLWKKTTDNDAETTDNDAETIGEKKYVKISSADVEFVSALEAEKADYTTSGRYKSYLQLKEEDKETKWYKITTDESGNKAAVEETNENVNNVLAESTYAHVYEAGKSYFYFDIQHLGYGVANADFGTVGVVRNHVYKVSINNIYGLGTPVPDDEEIIVPEKPDTETYVAARINILSWRVVNNNVDLVW